MNRTMGLAALAVLALAGCGRGDTVTAANESVEAVAGKVRANEALAFEPGRWETQLSFVPAPSMSEAEAAALRGRSVRLATCLSPEQAARPSADFFAAQSKDCRYEKFAMGGGTLSAVMRCTGAGASVMTMGGTYTPRHYQIDAEVRLEGQAESRVAMKLSADHQGACRGDESG